MLHANDFKKYIEKCILDIVKLHTRYVKRYRLRFAKFGVNTLSITTVSFRCVL